MLFWGVRQAGDEMDRYEDGMREDNLGIKVVKSTRTIFPNLSQMLTPR